MLWLLAASATPAVTLTPGYAFVTEQSGSSILSTWAEANGQSGIAAGDAICSTEAAAAQLADPQRYIAFISGSNDDLYCRLHGLTGTIANNCGMASLPNFAGPWLRRDNAPFATLATLLAPGRAIMPPLFTAEGINQVFVQAYTGTTEGLVADNTCSDWTANTGNVEAMFVDSISLVAGGGCSQSRSLLCIKSGANAPISYARRSGRLSFVTQEKGNGNLSTWTNANGAGGLAAGDQVCQSEAAAGGLANPASFKAWLSDGVHSINAIDRFQNDGPWIREDGLPVAQSKAALTNLSSIQSLPQVIGATLLPGDQIATGTLSTGVVSIGSSSANQDCLAWTSASASDSYLYGFAQIIGVWTQDGTPTCDATFNALYCFSDLDRIFDSGMESIPF
jgi:hypothetical protein